MASGAGGAPAEPFGAVLRRRRLAAGLTQEGLAERAGLSARGVSDLERGARRAPQRETVRRLARALGLRPAGVTALKAGAAAARTDGAAGRPRGRASVLASAPATWAPQDAGHGAGHNLPLQLTNFVGRERELAAVGGLLGTARLLTLTGPGGVGKTRLALEAAAGARATHPQGVRLVELAALADPDLVPQAVAAVLGVREEPGRPLLATLTDALRPRTVLLVLDNCEHLLDACARLAGALLRGCPRVRLLATSREPLGVAGEAAWPVPPLPVPALSGDAAPPPDPAELGRYAAVRLFVERAAAARPGFALTAANAAAVAAVCARLDGLPLAIELAAARVRVLPPPQLLARLEDRFWLLTGGGSDAPPRQRTLRATVEWSYALLDDPERWLFGRLAVFTGAWTLEAAEAVGADPGGDGGGAAAVLDRLTRLVDQSLVVAEEAPDGTARYRLLETLRQYARERLTASGEAAAVGGCHAAHFLALAEAGRAGLLGPDLVGWLARLEAAHDDLRAALRWLLGRGDGAGALRLAVGLGRFWHVRGHFAEGRAWLTEALAAPAPGAPGADAAKAAGAPATPDAALRAQALAEAGRLAFHQGDWAGAEALHRQALALRQTQDDEAGLARSLAAVADAAYQRGDAGRARALFEASLAGFRRAGDLHGAGLALCGLGTVVRHLEGPAAARPLYEESLALLRRAPDPDGVALALSYLGRVARAEGDLGRAWALQRAALRLRRTLGHRKATALSLRDLGTLAGRAGDHARAARLLAAAAALRRALGSPVSAAPPDDLAAYDGAVRAARARLGEAGFAAAWAAGEALSVDEAAAEALAAGPPPAVPANGHAPWTPSAVGVRGGLTPREREVAALIARGRSNARIAAELRIAEGTARRHVDNILNKLSFHSRTQIAVWTVARRPGLEDGG